MASGIALLLDALLLDPLSLCTALNLWLAISGHRSDLLVRSSGGLWGEDEGVQRRQRRSRPRGAAAGLYQDLRELQVRLSDTLHAACEARHPGLFTIQTICIG